MSNQRFVIGNLGKFYYQLLIKYREFVIDPINWDQSNFFVLPISCRNYRYTSGDEISNTFRMHDNTKNKYVVVYDDNTNFYKVKSIQNGHESSIVALDLFGVLYGYFELDLFTIEFKPEYAEDIEITLKSWNRALKHDFNSNVISFNDTVPVYYPTNKIVNVNLNEDIYESFAKKFYEFYKGASCEYTLNRRYGWYVYQLSKFKWQEFAEINCKEYFELEKAPGFMGDVIETVTSDLLFR